MSVFNSIDIEAQHKEQIPLRDWIVLPVLALLTILVIAVSTESIARWQFPASQTTLGNCFVVDDPSGTAPAKPYSDCSERLAESDYTAEYRFNSRGDRDDIDLQAKQPDTLRIVMIGSSFAMGLFVRREKSFAALLPLELSQQTGRRIELYNEAKGGKFRGGPYPIKSSLAKFDEVVSAQPDIILWIITPMDIDNSELGTLKPVSQISMTASGKQRKQSDRFIDIWNKFTRSIAEGKLGEMLRSQWEQSRSSLALQHLLIASESPDQYVESYLKNGEDAEFLKDEPSAQWQDLLRNFEFQAEGFQQKASSAGVPFVAVLIPNRAQSAMISTNSWPSGYDPYKLDNKLRTFIEDHGGVFIDVLPKFRNIPHPEQHYFPVDGHLDTQGHAMVAQLLSDAFANSVLASSGFNKHMSQAQTQGK